MYRAAKRDKNEREIIQVLRAMGASVVQLDDPSVPDLLVGFAGRNFLMEVKTETGKLTPSQVQFFDKWKGRAYVVRGSGDARWIIYSEILRQMSAVLIVKALQSRKQ